MHSRKRGGRAALMGLICVALGGCAATDVRVEDRIQAVEGDVADLKRRLRAAELRRSQQAAVAPPPPPAASAPPTPALTAGTAAPASTLPINLRVPASSRFPRDPASGPI